MPDIATLKLLGLAGVVSYAAARFAAKSGLIGYNRWLLVAVPVSDMPPMPRGFRVQPIDAAALCQHKIDIPEEVQQLRFAQQMTCLAAYNRRHEMVGVTWVGNGPFKEDSTPVRFHVPPDAAWDAGLWIDPKHRLGRGFAALWAGTAEWMQANDKSCSISWIADYNLPSLLAHKRMGAVTVGQIMIFRFFQWQYLREGRPKLIRTSGGKLSDVMLSRIDIERAFQEHALQAGAAE